MKKKKRGTQYLEYEKETCTTEHRGKKKKKKKVPTCIKCMCFVKRIIKRKKNSLMCVDVTIVVQKKKKLSLFSCTFVCSLAVFFFFLHCPEHLTKKEENRKQK